MTAADAQGVSQRLPVLTAPACGRQHCLQADTQDLTWEQPCVLRLPCLLLMAALGPAAVAPSLLLAPAVAAAWLLRRLLAAVGFFDVHEAACISCSRP